MRLLNDYLGDLARVKSVGILNDFRHIFFSLYLLVTCCWFGLDFLLLFVTAKNNYIGPNYWQVSCVQIKLKAFLFHSIFLYAYVADVDSSANDECDMRKRAKRNGKKKKIKKVGFKIINLIILLVNTVDLTTWKRETRWFIKSISIKRYTDTFKLSNLN